MKRFLHGTFRSLGDANYRIWAAGALVSNIGTWMQRTAQDWIVLVQLTPQNATAVGIVMSLQFGPQILLLPLTGYAADRFDLRRLLLVTQALSGLLALVLGVLTVTGLVQLWHVYAFALLLGCVTAFDTPARKVFVSEVVPENLVANAVALNATSFNAGRTLGPAVAGLLIAAVGTGWVFLLNGASFIAVLGSLLALQPHRLHRAARKPVPTGGFAAGLRYVMGRPDLRTVLLMFFLIGTFGVNFPIFISTMAVSVFHAGADQFGLLTSAMAVGSVAGALMSARRERPRIGFLVAGAAWFGIGFTLASVSPGYLFFAAALALIGLATQTFTTTANSAVQLWTEPSMRGRVVAILLALALGTTPIGAPFVGWVADRFGPRWALGVGAASGFAGAAVAVHYLVRHRHLRLEWRAGRLRLRFDPRHPAPSPLGTAVPPGQASVEEESAA